MIDSIWRVKNYLTGSAAVLLDILVYYGLGQTILQCLAIEDFTCQAKTA